MTIDVDALKASHPLPFTIERLTGQRIIQHKICCPFHEDGSPSLHVYDDGGWKCFGCGLFGDVLSFVGYLRFGAQYNPAMHFIDVANSLGAVDFGPLTPRPQEEPKPKPKQRMNVGLEAIISWNETMPAQRRAYWQSRGLTNQTIDEFMLGWDGQRYTIPAMWNLIPFGVKRRITPEDDKAETKKHLEYIATVRITHPEWCDESDSKVYRMAIRELKELHPEWNDRQILSIAHPSPIKYTGVYGSTPGLFNADILSSVQEVVICEGEIDAMLLHQSGISAVSVTAGAGKWEQKWARLFTHIRDVFVLYDNDEAGRTGTQKVQASIRRARAITLPDGVKDVGELYQATDNAADWVRWKMGR